ncbi:MAG TPA: hypothetical protein VN193_03555 [Candidatus Angelobacter sp.]|jgi:hypothetical protein|nr:hypothetical protein [Candidatus Angelobacter sp.]
MDTPEPDRTPAPGSRLGGLSRRTAVGITSAGLMVGGLAGGFLIGHAASPSDTTSTTAATASPSPSTGTAPDANGTFKSNEDPTHESGESAAREAQENAGQRPTVP